MSTIIFSIEVKDSPISFPISCALRIDLIFKNRLSQTQNYKFSFCDVF